MVADPRYYNPNGNSALPPYRPQQGVQPAPRPPVQSNQQGLERFRQAAQRVQNAQPTDYSRVNDWRTATGAAPVDPTRNRTDGRTNVFNNQRELFNYRQWASANPTAPQPAAPAQAQQPGQAGVIQQGLSEILQPQQPQQSQYSDPYEAWKAGGRQGPRPV